MDGRLTEAQYNNGWPERPSEHFHRDEIRCTGNGYPTEQRCGCGGELPEWTDRHALLFDLLEKLRSLHGGPLKVISGHRCLLHHLEESKPKFGSHTTGLAVDLIVLSGGKKMRMAGLAMAWASARGIGIGIGIGARQKVNKLHIDIAPWRDDADGGVAGWTY